VRVVSLVPSVTETLLTWGVVPVAVTRFCEQPALPAVGGTKDPDLGAIVALAPDLVVMDDEENRREDHDDLVASGVPVHVMRVRAVADVVSALAQLAGALGVTVDPLVLAPAEPERVRAFVPIWRRPWMSLNRATYGASVLAHLGVGDVVAGTRDRYPEVTLEWAASTAPDLVIAPSEPYPFGERHRAELERVAPVVLVDGRDLFWWGARTPHALVRLAAVLAGEPTV
jgi:ABC-type Fe3+-hydroxamate transport system substrate-binding protein